MSKIIENYILQESVGSGQYGKVYRGQNMKTEGTYAIKVVKIGKFKEVPKLHEFTMNEIKTLSKIENPNVIKFIEMLQTCNNVYLVYEFCNGGTLEELVQKRKFLPEGEALLIFNQILNAFKSLVKENILHRDLKPSNILLHDGVIKVADFGFCKALLGPQDLTKTMVGSPIYMAPEILKGCNYSIKADIWSMGVVLFEILFGFCPYEDRTIARLINQIDHKPLTIPRHINKISRKTEDLLKKLLVVEPRYRIDWNNLLKINLLEDEIPRPPSSLPTQTATTMMTSQTYVSNLQNMGMPSNPIEKKLMQKKVSTIAPTPLTSNNNVNMGITYEQSNFQESVNHNLKVLLRERNKLIFCMNVLTNVLENQINERTPVVAYLLYKNVLLFADSLKQILKEDSSDPSPLKPLSSFRSSPEFKSFLSLLLREIGQISSCSSLFKDELSKNLDVSLYSIKNDLENPSINKKLLYDSILTYAGELKEKVHVLANERNNDGMRKLLMLGNELMDAVNIDEFFEKCINENCKYAEQTYFEQMRRSSLAELNQIFGSKCDIVAELARREVY